MTKLHIMSDLHLEFDKYTLQIPQVDADILILAGDIGVGTAARDWILNLSDRYKHILYIFGNHEYYHQNYRDLRASVSKIEDSWNSASKGAKIYIFDPGSTQIGDITFIGATLWTDFKKEDPNIMMGARYVMNDYYQISDYDKGFELKAKLYPEIVLKQHYKDLDFITTALNDIKGKKVVISHHAPSYLSVHNDYRNSRDHETNFCYFTDLDHLVPKADLWIHGHTHCTMNYQIEDTRVICNPRGYYGHSENPAFNPALIVEV